MFLDDAMAAAVRSVRLRMELLPWECLESMAGELPPPPSFREAVTRANGRPRLVAEVKRSSPSAGVIRQHAPVAAIAAEYERGGASAVSVLTSDYRFGGCVADLEEARSACGLPLLRKDFISREYQVLEARAFGASAVLLIAEALSAERLDSLATYARELGMEALVESHSPGGLEKAVASGAKVLGINNRDLATLEVDTGTTERLMPLVPPGVVVVSESGVRTVECARRMASLGVDALLMGEEFMRAPMPGRRLREFVEALKAAVEDESVGEAGGGEPGRDGLVRETGSTYKDSEGEVYGSCG